MQIIVMYGGEINRVKNFYLGYRVTMMIRIFQSDTDKCRFRVIKNAYLIEALDFIKAAVVFQITVI